MVIFLQMGMDRDIQVTADQAILDLKDLVILPAILNRQWVVHIRVNLVDIPDFVDILVVILDSLVFRVRADIQDNSLGHQQQVQHHNTPQLKPLLPPSPLPVLKVNKDNRDRRFHIIRVTLVWYQMDIRVTLVCVRVSLLDLVMDQCLLME